MAGKPQGAWNISFETPRRAFPRGLHFRNIDMKAAEGGGSELSSDRAVTLDVRQAQYAVSSQT
jgi:hypothetical protein